MKSIHLHIQKEDIPYLPMLKTLVQGRAQVSLSDEYPTAVLEIVAKAKKKNAQYIGTTSPKLLQLLLGKVGEKLPSIDAYAGSIIEKYGYEFLILPPLDSLVKIFYGRHLYERYLKKFLQPSDWLQIPDFQWQVFRPADQDDLLTLFQGATLTAVDIETGPEEFRIITSISFTNVFIDPDTKSFTTHTVVVPFDDYYNVLFVRKALQSPVPKVFQNGKYDHAYLLRYNAPTTNWAFDTINMFHSWYSELPKDLGFLTSYMLRKWVYWKDESKTVDLYQKYQYNAKDSFTTAMDCLALLREMPQWAIENFKMEFPLVFPCLLAEMTGIKCDDDQRKKLKLQLETSHELRLRNLRIMVNNPNYNPGSWQQNERVFAMLGSGDIKGTGKIPTDKAKARHPLNDRILTEVENYKKDVKLEGSYTKEEAVWCGRIFFAINPHGTDTGRLASKESQFWCGLQIHNIPRDRKDVQIKSQFIADAGFYIGEADYSQAEARDTAYLSGDEVLIKAVDDPSKDFHSFNAAEFFGLKYEEICESVYDEVLNVWIHKRLLIDIIDIAKRTNHGSNYNMGARVLLDTMGIKNVIRAKHLLKLPALWSLLSVCEYLLKKYADTYKVVKGDWYKKCISDVVNTNFLISPTGWRRFCFGRPDKSKVALNAYVAHPPQNLNAMTLNKAYMKVFQNIWMNNQNDFRLNPQIHDSILFQYRKGRLDLAVAVKKEMEMDMPVKDIYGKVRTLRVPVDLKGEADRWSDIKKLQLAA